MSEIAMLRTVDKLLVQPYRRPVPLLSDPKVPARLFRPERTSKKGNPDRFSKMEASKPRKGRILVVDHQERIREIVCAMLSDAGHQCRTASDGLEALAALDSGEEFDVLFTNLMMPNLDGIGLLERTKQEFPDVPVVLETAVHDISVALAFIRSGGYDYLQIPFEREQLLNVVNRALEYRRLKVSNRARQA